MCKLVLHVLKLVEVLLRDAVEERVALVDPSADDVASDRISNLACQVTFDVAKSSDVIVARTYDPVNVVLERQCAVERNAESFQFFAYINNASGDSDGRRPDGVPQFLPGSEKTHLQLVRI